MSAMSRGLHQLHRCHTMPGRGSPGTAGSSAGLPGLLHAGRLPEHAGLLPLPQQQGKEGPASLSCTHILPIPRADVGLLKTRTWENGPVLTLNLTHYMTLGK